MDKNKVESFVNNEELIGRLDIANSVEEVKCVFKDGGIELSDNETVELLELCSLVSNSDGGELSEEMLESVAGGAAVSAWTIITTAWSCAKSVSKTFIKLGEKFANWEQKKK